MSKPSNPELVNRIRELVLSKVETGGSEGLTMRSLAKELNVSAPTIYYYFKDKSELLELVRDYALEELHTTLENAVLSKTKPSKKLEMLSISLLNWSKEHPELFKLAFDKPNFSIAKDLETSDKYYGTYMLIYEIIFHGLEIGEFRKTDPKLASHLFFASLLGLAQHTFNNNFDNRFKTDATALIAEFHKGFIRRYLKKK